MLSFAALRLVELANALNAEEHACSHLVPALINQTSVSSVADRLCFERCALEVARLLLLRLHRLDEVLQISDRVTS